MKHQDILRVSRRGPIAIAIATALGTSVSVPAYAAVEPGAAVGPPVSLFEIAVGADVEIVESDSTLGGIVGDVAIDADGDGVAVWVTEQASDPYMTAVRFRRIHGDGTLGEILMLVEQDARRFDFEEVQVAVDADGDAVVVWTEDDNDTGDSTIGARLVGADDQPKGAAFEIGLPDSLYPAVGMDAAGNFVVAWYHTEVYFQRFGADGAPLDEEQRASVTDYGNEPALAVSAKGDFTVAWVESIAVGNVYARTYTADGTPFGAGKDGEFLIAADAIDGDLDHVVEVAMDGDGDLAFAWSGYEMIPDGDSGTVRSDFIRATRFAADGTALLADNVELYSGDYRDRRITGIAFDPDGDPIVGWMASGYIKYDDDRDDTTVVSVGAARVNADGTKEPLALDFDTACDTVEEQCPQPQALAFDADGDMLMSYTTVGNNLFNVPVSSLHVQRFRGGESTDLAATLEASADEVHPGDDLTVKLTVENRHPLDPYYGASALAGAIGATRGVQVDLTLPEGLDVGGEPEGWSCTDPADGKTSCTHPGALWSAGELVLEVAFQVPADADGKYTMSASVTSADPDSDAGNNADELSVTVSPKPDDTDNPPPASGGGGGGGGGALGWLALLLVPLVRLRNVKQ